MHKQLDEETADALRPMLRPATGKEKEGKGKEKGED